MAKKNTVNKVKSLKTSSATWKKVMQIKLDKDFDTVDETVKYMAEELGY